MPVHKTRGGKWKWGQSGKEYSSKAAAEKQARAIYANGYRDDRRPGPEQEFPLAETTPRGLYEFDGSPK